jgi:hypothetical protein
MAAAFILFGLRMIQGLCLGGDGGAIAPSPSTWKTNCGYYTGWLQTSATLGIVVSLAVIVPPARHFGNEAFNAWAWRVPFLLSFLMLAIAIYIRLSCRRRRSSEIKAKGQMTEALEGGLPQQQHQIHTDRHRRADRARRSLVQRSVLGAVLPAAGFQGGSTEFAYIVGARCSATPSSLLAGCQTKSAASR